jgi:cell division transport system ATP-binding protein
VVVRLENIAKWYDAAPILADVSLVLDPGGFYFLTGASGAGKSTLLKIISLVERPSRGRLRLFGADPAALDRDRLAALRRRIGIVFQYPRLLDELSARDNVALPLRICGAAPREIRDNVSELLTWVGLAKRADVPAGHLSGSERQRIAIARAIVRRPDLLIADEPTCHADDEVRMLLVRIFESVNRLGTTVLIATHDAAFAGQFAYPCFHLGAGMLSEAAAEEVA